jgi:hypothetical protein
MPTTAEVVARVSRIAAGQWGLLTAAQAAREDITRSQLTRLAGAGVLERVERGVYATTSSTDENRGLRAAWIALDPAQTAEERLANPVDAGVISHTSAAGLHQLGDLLDDVPEVTYPHRKQTRRGIRLHRGDLSEAEITLVKGLPTTTEERTVADLLRDGHDLEHVAQIVGQGVRRGVIDLTDLAEHVEALGRRYGQPDGRALVAYLLDLVGLSPTALARDLAKSTTGQELMAAGRVTAIGEMLASMMPELDLAPLLALNKTIADVLGPGRLDGGKLAGLHNTLESMQLSNPAATQIEQIAKNMHPSVRATVAGTEQLGIQAALASMRSPSLQGAHAQIRTPATRAAVEAAQSPAAVAAEESVASEAGRSAFKATQAQSPTDETEEKA